MECSRELPIPAELRLCEGARTQGWEAVGFQSQGVFDGLPGNKWFGKNAGSLVRGDC